VGAVRPKRRRGSSDEEEEEEWQSSSEEEDEWDWSEGPAACGSYTLILVSSRLVNKHPRQSLAAILPRASVLPAGWPPPASVLLVSVLRSMVCVHFESFIGLLCIMEVVFK
jgi:hypothetical protein